MQKNFSFIRRKIQDPKISLQFTTVLINRYAFQLKRKKRVKFLTSTQFIIDQKIGMQRERILRETAFILTEPQIATITDVRFLESHLQHLLNVFPILITYIDFVDEDTIYTEIFSNKKDLIRAAVFSIKKRLTALVSINQSKCGL